jgi:hypothetical protein
VAQTSPARSNCSVSDGIGLLAAVAVDCAPAAISNSRRTHTARRTHARHAAAQNTMSWHEGVFEPS